MHYFIESSSNHQFRPLAITLEHARTFEQQQWGLMQRSSLPCYHGMLFSYEPPQNVTIWSFNCLIDLDLAFIDKSGLITQLTTLKAYPEMMDPLRPVRSVGDIARYLPQDPCIRFFIQHSITSKMPCRRVLEAAAGFFAQNGISEGDRCIFIRNRALIYRQYKSYKLDLTQKYRQRYNYSLVKLGDKVQMVTITNI